IREVVVIVLFEETLFVIIHPGDVVARVVRRPEFLHQSAGQGVETVARNLVAIEGLYGYSSGCRVELRCPGIINGTDSAIDIARLREVPGRFEGGRYRVHVAVRIADLPIFERGEVEKLVFDDRVAEGESGHMLPLRIQAEPCTVGFGA